MNNNSGKRSLFSPGTGNFDELCAEFSWEIPEHFNIGVEVCDRHASNRTAIYCENDQGDEAAYTFNELKDLSNRFANALRALGINRGDRVAVILPQRIETAVAHIAAYKLGAVALPLSILFGKEGLEYRLGNSESAVVITDRDHTSIVSEIRGDLPDLKTVVCCDDNSGSANFWDLIKQSSPEFTPVNTLADDPAILLYTSGTTGPPKGALDAHRCLIGNLTGFELSQNFYAQGDRVFFTPADWAWTGGLLDALLPSLFYGMPVLGYAGKRFDPEKACALMEKYAVTNAFIPPTAMKMLMQVDNIQGRYDLKLRAIMSAGEQVAPKLLDWAEKELGAPVNEMWGQTEFNYLVGNCSAIMPVKPGSMGKAYPGHRVEVINDEGEPLPAGESGEIAAHIGDPVMFLGYWKRESATQEKITNGWFRSGDVGYKDEDGYLFFMGRKDDVISSAGYRIGPGEIEDCLIRHPAVAQTAVIGVPDELRGEIVKAFIVLAEGFEASDELAETIKQSVRTRLAAYEYPRELEFIDELPMTTTGKVMRNELRARGRGEN